jgi:DNA-binding response OmpR family regulator
VAAVLAADQAALIQDLRNRFGAMPILLDLERDSVEARSACLGTGADDFWLSEIGTSDLLLRLRLHRTIQQRLGQRPALLQFDDLSVDPTTRTVRRGGRVVALTAREFMLLQVLLRRRGQVLSRDLLLQEVWQGERSSSNVVEVYVRYLRQKLEAGGERRLLHTVRGRGYCFGQVLQEA